MSDDIDNAINYIQNWTCGEEFDPPSLSVPVSDPDVDFYRQLHRNMFRNAHEELPGGYPEFRQGPFMYMPPIYPNYDMSYVIPDFNQLTLNPPVVDMPDLTRLLVSTPVNIPDFNQLNLNPPVVDMPDFNQLQISTPVPAPIANNMFRPINGPATPPPLYQAPLPEMPDLTRLRVSTPPLELDEFGSLRISTPPAKRRRRCPEMPDFTRLQIATPPPPFPTPPPPAETWLEMVSNLRNEYRPPRYEDTNGLREWEYYPMPPRNFRRCACLPDDNPPKRQRR